MFAPESTTTPSGVRNLLAQSRNGAPSYFPYTIQRCVAFRRSSFHGIAAEVLTHVMLYFANLSANSRSQNPNFLGKSSWRTNLRPNGRGMVLKIVWSKPGIVPRIFSRSHQSRRLRPLVLGTFSDPAMRCVSQVELPSDRCRSTYPCDLMLR